MGGKKKYIEMFGFSQSHSIACLQCFEAVGLLARTASWLSIIPEYWAAMVVTDWSRFFGVSCPYPVISVVSSMQ